MITMLKDWVVTLGGAAIMVALAQGMMPSRSMERELKLVLSLVIWLAFFTVLTQADLSALVEWDVQDGSVQAFQTAGKTTVLSGSLFIAREELGTTLQSDVSQAFGHDFVVEQLVFGGTEQDVQVEQVVFRTLYGVEEEEMSRYLENRFGLTAQVKEVEYE